MGWELWQLDVVSAFLYGQLKEKVFLKIPNGFYEKEKKAGKVLRLDKSLYGLKQSGRVWYQTLQNHLQANGFTNCSLDRCAFIKRSGVDVIIVLVYVDDLIYTASNTKMMEEFKTVMSSKFKMKDLGSVEYVVGLRVRSTKNATHLSQSLYGNDILKRFNLQDAVNAKTPLPERTILYPKQPEEPEGDSTIYRSMVGSLMYSMLGSRPDLAFVVGQLSRHLHACTSKLIGAAEQAFRYIRYTINDGLSYSYQGPDDSTSRRKSVSAIGYSDADWAGDIEDSKSTSGYIITMANAPIIWKSMKQKSVAKSSTEAETAAADSCCNEIIWIRGMLNFFGFPQLDQSNMSWVYV
jgi:hypothetical protein